MLWPPDGLADMHAPAPKHLKDPKDRHAVYVRVKALRQLHAHLFPEDTNGKS